jgi:hypothetical protein
MNRTLPAAVLALLALGSAATLAQSPPGGPAPAASSVSRLELKTMDEFSTKPLPLNEFLDELRKSSNNSINITFSAIPGQTLPTVPAIKTKFVTVPQVLGWLVDACPGVSVRQIQAQGNTLEREPLLVTETGVIDPNIFLAVSYTPPAAGKQTWRMFRITDAINAQYNRIIGSGKFKGPTADQEYRKEALNQVLSVVQAGLRLSDDKSQPVVQVHEDTEMLLVKGSEEQGRIVDSLLATLLPPPRPEELKQMEQENLEAFRRAESKLQREIDAVQVKLEQRDGQLAAMRKQLDDAQASSLELLRENERLKIRLESKEKSAAPSPKE